MRLTLEYLYSLRTNGAKHNAWLHLSRELVKLGYVLTLYEANTKSRYITVRRNATDKDYFTIRFSGHEVTKSRLPDFVCGGQNEGSSWQDAIIAVKHYFGDKQC
jgi:hypothetical protein